MGIPVTTIERVGRTMEAKALWREEIPRWWTMDWERDRQRSINSLSGAARLSQDAATVRPAFLPTVSRFPRTRRFAAAAGTTRKRSMRPSRNGIADAGIRFDTPALSHASGRNLKRVETTRFRPFLILAGLPARACPFRPPHSPSPAALDAWPS